jgi:hypothetical protein
LLRHERSAQFPGFEQGPTPMAPQLAATFEIEIILMMQDHRWIV